MRVMFKILASLMACMLIASTLTQARIHHLVLDDDSREQVTISTFGFLKNGVLQLKVNKLSVDSSVKLDSVRNSFAFIIEKNSNRGFSSFSSNDRNQDFCSKMFRFKQKNKENGSQKGGSSSFNYNQMIPEAIINSKSIFTTKDRTYYLVVFQLDLAEKQINISRVGGDLRNLIIKPEFTYSQYGFNSEYKPYQYYSSNQTTREALTTTVDDLNSLIDEKNILLKTIKLNITEKSSISFKFELNIKSSDEEGLYTLSFYNCFQPDIYAEYLTSASKTTSSSSDKTVQSDLIAESGLAYVKNSDNIKYGVHLDLELMERNEDSFLSAGEMPVPTLYLTWSIIYFLAGISWTYILRSSKGDVFKIHYLMLGLVFIKAITLTFHAINMHYIAVNGRHEAVWAILYYITYVLRGLLLIISILLVGTGWTFIKHVLSENERRLFVIVIPLQIVAVIAYIFLEEKEEGDAVYVTWRQLFFLVDLLCCGAILFPVVWSIKHLESASQTDGKMVINLKKLKIFKHFYIMVICYIYFTRIIGFLMAQVIPFRYEWFDELSTEVVTFTFFALTAYKFQPASNNPYLQLSQSGNDDDIDEETQLQMEKLNSELNDEQELINGNVDTVLDLIDQNYHSRATNSTTPSYSISNNVSPSSGDLSYRKPMGSTKI